MINFGIFYTRRYLKFVRAAQKIDLRLFTAKKNGQSAILPHHVKGNTLYGLRYGGMASKSGSDVFAAFVSNKFMEYCRAQKIKTFVIRNNPFINTISIGKVIKKEAIVFVDLRRSITNIYNEISLDHRKRIERAREDKLIVRQTDEIKYLELFYAFYSNFCEKRNMRPQTYLFFKAFYAYLRKNINLIHVVQNGRSIAVTMALESKPNVFMMYGAMDAEGYNKCAKHLMIYELMLRYKRKGYSHLVLGTGVNGERDAVYQFKRGFVGQESHIYTYGDRL